jgi:hypothetical protein
MQKECKEPVINISDEKAKEVALEYFQKYNKDGIVRPETNLVYADNKIDKGVNPIYEVCYIVTIDGKTDKDASSSWKVFVSSENGNILNVLKDGAEKEVITKSN